VTGGVPPTGRRTVAFTGERSGTAALTWAQREIWDMYELTRPHHAYFNLMRLFSVPPGRTVDDALTAVRLLVERYEALRTTVHSGPDGEPVQRVAATGVCEVEIFDVAPAEAGPVAEEVATLYVGHPFADDEWPARLAVVAAAGRAAYVVLAASHLAIDRTGLDVLSPVLTGLLADPGRDFGPAGRQPLDQVAFEESPRGRRTAERAVAYWRRHLTTVPPLLFDGAGTAPAARPWPAAGMESVAAATAARVLAGRHRASVSGVVLAAAAALLAARTRRPDVAMQIIIGNRFSLDVRGMVGTCVQAGLFRVAVGTGSFDGLVGRSWSAMLQANRHAQFPPPAVRGVFDEVNRERGVRLDVHACFHSYLDGDPAWKDPLADADRDELAASVSRTRLRRMTVWPNFRGFNLDVRASRAALRLGVWSYPTWLSQAEVETLLRGVETLLVRAVHEDVDLADLPALTGVTAPPDPPGRVRIDSCLVDPAAVRAVVADVPGVAEAVIRTDGLLVAEVVTDDPTLTPQRLHVACVERLPAHGVTHTPGRYVIRMAGSDAVREGTGRTPEAAEVS
jgi:hypothetical protein